MTGYGGSDATDPEGWNVGKDDAIDAFFQCAAGPDMAPGLGLRFPKECFAREKSKVK